MPYRLFWQNAAALGNFFLIISQIAEYLGLHPRAAELVGSTPFSLRSLITFSGADGRVSDRCATVLFFCCVLFVIRYTYAALYPGCVYKSTKKIKPLEIIVWAIVLLIILAFIIHAVKCQQHDI